MTSTEPVSEPYEPGAYGRQVARLYRSVVRSSIRQMPFDASSPEAFLAWQEAARLVLLRALGELPREKVGLRLTRKVVRETPRYVQERIEYTTRPGLRVPAYLFTPRDAEMPAPAMLCLHGHSTGGKDEVVDPQSPYRGFGRTFAERGCVVLCPDQIAFGERRLADEEVAYPIMVHGLNMIGQSLLGWRSWDLVRALDLLEGLETVRRDRIGVMGLSLGGETTAFLAALQTRVRAACVCGFFSSNLNSFLRDTHCPCAHLYDLARQLEHIDVAAMIAPRPLFVDSGLNDPHFPTRDARALVRGLRPVYDLFGRPPSYLGIEVHGGGHEISGRKSIPWMIERLWETGDE